MCNITEITITIWKSSSTICTAKVAPNTTRTTPNVDATRKLNLIKIIQQLYIVYVTD